MKYLFRILGILGLVAAGLGLYVYSQLFYLTDDLAILKVTMTGNTCQKCVEWKTPQGKLRKESLTCYEIHLSSEDGSPLSTFFLYGDLCAVRAKVLRLHPLLNKLGFKNLYQIETVYNGYRTAEGYAEFPVEAIDFSGPETGFLPCQRLFWDTWKKSFSDYYTSKWIKSATWESCYFPLIDSAKLPYQGSFHVIISSGGLSSF
jgi:hypothetical protein